MILVDVNAVALEASVGIQTKEGKTWINFPSSLFNIDRNYLSVPTTKSKENECHE